MSVIDNIAGKVRGMPVSYLAQVINNPNTPDAVKTAAFLEMNEQKRLTESAQQQQMPQGTVKDQTMQSMGLMALQNGRAQQGMQQMAQQLGRGQMAAPGAAPIGQAPQVRPAPGPQMGMPVVRAAKGGLMRPTRYAEGGLTSLLEGQLKDFLQGNQPEIEPPPEVDRTALREAEMAKRQQMEEQRQAMQEYAARRQGAFDTEQKGRSTRDFLTALVAGAEASRGQKGLGALASILGKAGSTYAGSQNEVAQQREAMLEKMYAQQQEEQKQKALMAEYDRSLAEGDYTRAKAIKDEIYKGKVADRAARNKAVTELYPHSLRADVDLKELAGRASEGALDRASRERIAASQLAAARERGAGGAGGGLGLTRLQVKAAQDQLNAINKALTDQSKRPQWPALEARKEYLQGVLANTVNLPELAQPTPGVPAPAAMGGGKYNDGFSDIRQVQPR